MAVSAKNFALINFCQQFVHRHFRVLANAEQFVAAYMVEIKRGSVRVVSAYRAPAFGLDFVNQVSARLLKRLRY
jgi:hypothetical protein